METASFTARRPAASNLPSFQLPPPEPLGMHNHKYQQTNNYIHGTTRSSSQPVPAVANNILTPPAGVSHDGLSPLASSVNSGSSGSSAAGVPPYQSSAFWSNSQSGNNFAFTSAPPMNSPYAQQQQQGYMNRPLYSPSMSNYPGSRNPNSPTSSEGLPPPSFESLPPFTTNLPMSGSGGQQQNLPTLAPQNSQQQQQQQMNNQNLMNLHQSSSQASQQGSAQAPDNYGGRAPPTPSYYPQSSTPQQSSFPAYAQQSPTQQSPNTSSAPSNRISPIQTHHSHSSMGAPHQGYSSRSTFPHYNLPTLTAPILSNVHQPGSQMALLGGMGNMAYPQQMPGPMYGGHHPQQMPQSDKQFKCDQCPQSFSRNHDLKRHKRIHLAVKPFPCGHCEKSFSRKDALKRHILVKGCGTKPTNATTNPNGDSQSPLDKSEVLSDSTNDDSPEMVKKELS